MQERGEGVPSVQEAAGSGDQSEETVETVEVADENPNETVEETVTRAFNQLKTADNGDGGDGPPTTKEVGTQAPKAQVDQVKLPEDVEDPELAPPERLDARGKKLFNLAPKNLRKALHRTIKDIEAQTTRATQDLRRQESDLRDVVEATAPYVNKWSERGLSRAAAIAGLAAAQEKLTHTDPTVRVDTFIKLGQDLGVDFDRLAEYVKTGGNGGSQIAQDPEYQALRQTVGSLQSRLEQQDRAQNDAIVSQLTAEGIAVRDEIDEATGNYRYPKLQEAEFLERVKPVVSALLGNTPGLSYGDAIRRSYSVLEGQPVASGQLIQPTLPAANKQNVRAIAAAGSVRGRSAPVTTNDAAIPPEAFSSPEASARWALQHLRRGGI